MIQLLIRTYLVFVGRECQTYKILIWDSKELLPLLNILITELSCINKLEVSSKDNFNSKCNSGLITIMHNNLTRKYNRIEIL